MSRRVAIPSVVPLAQVDHIFTIYAKDVFVKWGPTARAAALSIASWPGERRRLSGAGR
jgi:hypothetical protein